jgi:hypothetical protein
MTPVMYLDPSGESFIAFAIFMGIGAILGGTLGYYTALDSGADIFTAVLMGAALGAGVGAIFAFGSAAIVGGMISVSHKVIADITAYGMFGKEFGGWESYTVAFIFGGLSSNAGQVGKFMFNCIARPLVDQSTNIVLRNKVFNLEKFGVDVFRRSVSSVLPKEFQAFFKGVVAGAYDKYADENGSILRFDYA